MEDSHQTHFVLYPLSSCLASACQRWAGTSFWLEGKPGSALHVVGVFKKNFQQMY